MHLWFSPFVCYLDDRTSFHLILRMGLVGESTASLSRTKMENRFCPQGVLKGYCFINGECGSGGAWESRSLPTGLGRAPSYCYRGVEIKSSTTGLSAQECFFLTWEHERKSKFCPQNSAGLKAQPCYAGYLWKPEPHPQALLGRDATF